ncbi:heparan sulfate 2-O-sulfotransferase pipe isoform X2 [Eurosta solidaginis]|uniref:heparan sulfate 2-O-sulfotransferase pipe isoform X2 n=1 Tax=Eurosta solidaginis TaxID=178769 RepID=UPI003530B53D
MSLSADKSFKMKMRDMENAFKYRRIPYPKRSVELIAILAISCTFFLFMHTNKLNSRLKEMEVKLQPSEFSALGLTGNQINSRESSRRDNIYTLHGTYQYLKSTGQRGTPIVRQHRRRHQNDELTNDEKKLHKVQDHRNEQLHNNNKKSHPVQLRKFRNSHDNNHNTINIKKDIDDDDDDNDEIKTRNLSNSDESGDTKSMFLLQADELNNTKKADVDLLVFNRVAKVGSQSLMQLMGRLSKVNGYGASRDTGKRYETVLLTPKAQREFAAQLLVLPKPHAYSQHLAYINFTRFHMPKPIYINLVRDPIERVVSWHYYIRAEWYYIDMKDKLGDQAPPRPSDEFMNMDLDTCVRTQDKYCQFTQDDALNQAGDHRRQTLFFCGQNKKLCLQFNSQTATQIAKRNIETEYAVVGSWEDTNITLAVLERYIPRFFRGATEVFYSDPQRFHKNATPHKHELDPDIEEKLKIQFSFEIELYNFCKQRLYKQYIAIKKEDMMKEYN